MKKHKKLSTAVLGAVMTAALLLASCSNDSGGLSLIDLGSGSASSLITSTASSAAYKGTFTVNGKAFTHISFSNDLTYTMTGSGVSDTGSLATSLSANAKSLLIINGGTYYMISKNIKNSKGEFAKWVVTVTEKTEGLGNSITLSALSSTTSGYVSVNGTGYYIFSDGATPMAPSYGSANKSNIVGRAYYCLDTSNAFKDRTFDGQTGWFTDYYIIDFTTNVQISLWEFHECSGKDRKKERIGYYTITKNSSDDISWSVTAVVEGTTYKMTYYDDYTGGEADNVIVDQGNLWGQKNFYRLNDDDHLRAQNAKTF